jgi:hypothetical protein
MTCQITATETQRTLDLVQIRFQFWLRFGLDFACTMPGSSLDLVRFGSDLVWLWSDLVWVCFGFGLDFGCNLALFGSSSDMVQIGCVWIWFGIWLGFSWPLLGPDLVRIPLNSFLWIWFGVSSALVRTWLGFSLRLCLDLVGIWFEFRLNSIWIWFDTGFSFDIASIWLEFGLIWFWLSWMSLGWFELVWRWFRFGQNLCWTWLGLHSMSLFGFYSDWWPWWHARSPPRRNNAHWIRFRLFQF